MRFNKQELTALATQPSQKFDKEGVLFLRERQEGFFRRTDRKDGRKGRRSLGSRDLSCVGGLSKVHLERWCRLRGNLLFYFKSRDQWSEPLGVIVLQQSDIKVDPPGPDGPYGFTLVFEGGASQHLSAGSEGDRDAWLLAIQAAGYGAVRATLLALEQRLETRRRQDPNLDVHMWRLRVGKTVDPCELPLCEVSLACDNLLCDGHGRPPNPVLVVHVSVATPPVWVKYAKTELVERSSNPVFLSTVCFRAGDGISADTRVRITAHDLREPVSETATLIGSATVDMRTIQETDRLRIPLRSAPGTTVGFVSLAVWSLEREERGGSTESTPCRTPPEAASATVPNHPFGHRRSQSLPPTLGCRLRLPAQGALGLLFAGPFVQTYRFHSGLGGDISVHELMAESRLAFAFPQQLLGVWIQEEKELLQEVAAMGELREPWHSRQVELLDRHLHLLHLYSQAKEHLAAHKGSHFKASARKNERALEFAPVNLHLQRMWAHNDTLRCSGLYDVVTVGAFTAHSHKSKNGGLLRLLQAGKETCCEPREPRKTAVALDAITAIKTLRREVVDGMRQLMRLARDKQPAGMLPICDDMIGKTRALLGLWDPGLVEEALAFVEEHKVPQTTLDESDEGVGLEAPRRALSPYRRITQRLRLELRCPDSLDELATPDSPRRAAPFWDLPTPDNAVSSYAPADFAASPADNETQFVIFPDADDSPRSDTVRDSPPKDADDDGIVPDGACNGGECRRFLDTAAMSSSPTANYYKPTDEPEPWDLTQLNIEASVMCLVSKVKFLCGRCGSPAVRLRSRGSMSRSRSFRAGPAPVEPVAVVTAQPARRMTFAEGAGLSADMTGEEVIDKVAATVTASVCARNKFTDGLDFASITDWAGELRPAMRKLRQAMDGLLKTARLTHSVFRVQEDARAAQRACNVQYRRDVCFAQALTSLAAGLSARLWCRRADPGFIAVLAALGPLASFQGLLSHCGDEVDMWGDMVVAVEDLVTVTFTITRVSPTKRPEKSWLPRAVGSRAALTVLLPAPDSVIALLPCAAPLSFKVTPVFFNVGINEMATLAESLGNTKPQDKSNADNAERLAEYHRRYRRLALPSETNVRRQPPLPALVQRLRDAAAARTSKNVDVLHLSAHICRRMKGLRFTSCKSAKDRTGMSVTLEQSQILAGEYDLSEHEHQRALDCMRSEGCRRENACKNTGVRRYAFNSLQLLTLPRAYRPPAGTYGSAQT